MKSFQAQTFYELLEVSVGAGDSDIRSAFERLARLYAEDQVALYGLIDEGRARALRGRLKEAADTLLDAERRATYDAGLGLPPRELPKRPAPAPAVTPRASAPGGWAGSYAFVGPTVAVSAPVATSFSYTIAAPVTAPARPSAPVAPKLAEAAAPVAEPKLEAPKPEVRVEVVQRAVAPANVSTPVEPAAIVAAAPAGAPPIAAAPSEPAAPAAAPQLPESPPIAAAPSEPATPPVAIAAVPSEPPSPVSAPSIVPAAPEAVATEPAAPVVAAPERPAEPAVSPPIHAVAPAEPPAAPATPSVAASAEPLATTPPAVTEAEEVRAAPPVDDESPGSSIVPTRPYAPREYRPPERSKPYEVPAGVEFNGDLLRQVRMARGLSLLQVAERTRIGVRHLENLENDRYEQLPVAVYLRGMLMSLARELGLDGIRVSKSYLTFVEAHHSKSKG